MNFKQSFQGRAPSLLPKTFPTLSLVIMGLILTFTPVFTQSLGGAVGALPLAGPNRPANVPSGYAVTPFGYFHPSCVRRLAKGERLLSDGRVQHADGTAENSAAACSYPTYTAAGLPKAESFANLPQVNGWIENANITTGSASISYGALIATWTVPPHPSADDGQTLFFFPGFEDINDTQSILQPVLQWFHKQWSIASWNCCLGGIITESPAVNVSPDDEVYGSITSNCPPGTLSCDAWNVLSLDLSTGDSTTLSSTPSDGQIFNWAFGGVMEPYSVASCEDYPPNHRITFRHIRLFDQFLNPIADPEWTEVANSSQKPHCQYDTDARAHEVSLGY